VKSLEAIESWESRRARLSHDELKNELSPAVSKLCRVLEEQVYDPDFIEWFRVSCPPRIKRLGDELMSMVKSAPESLSPRQFFDSAPLSSCDRKTKQWLPAAIHDLWMASAGVQSRLAATAEHVNKLHAALVRLETTFQAESVSRQHAAALELQRALADLSCEVSNVRELLPYRR